jgi:hypothetical protein
MSSSAISTKRWTTASADNWETQWHADPVKSVGELVTRRDDIAKARDTLDRMSAALDTDLAAADTAHSN